MFVKFFFIFLSEFDCFFVILISKAISLFKMRFKSHFES